LSLLPIMGPTPSNQSKPIISFALHHEEFSTSKLRTQALDQDFRGIAKLGSELDCSVLNQINQHALDITSTHANALICG